MDGDTILAEIRSIAINHGGGRISSLAAPSSEAQTEVIVQAWEKAKINVSKIRFIEAHGTGTILGDPIEIEGIKQAFIKKNLGHNDASCAISSFKGQIGHLDYLAGLAGLLRLMAALNYSVIPAQANFKTLNEFFKLKGTGLYVPTTTEDWISENNERVGGVSSFGMIGTNVHLVVSQKDNFNTKIEHEKEYNYLQISHSNPQNLRTFKDYLAEKIKELTDESMTKLPMKLNKVFKLGKENQGIVYSSKETLITALNSDNTPCKKRFLLLDLDILHYPKESIESIFLENSLIKDQWDKHVAIQPRDIGHQHTLNMLFQYSIYKYLLEKVNTHIKFITTKEDSILNLLLKSDLTVTQILNRQYPKEQTRPSFDEKIFRKYLQENFLSKEVIIIDFSKQNKNRFNTMNTNWQVIDGAITDKDRFSLYSNILVLGINPLKTSLNPRFNDIELPFFKPKRFWPKLNEDLSAISKVNTGKFRIAEIKNIVIKTWSTVLELDEFEDDDDFFDLGGTSLSALDMLDELEQNIVGIKLSYEERLPSN